VSPRPSPGTGCAARRVVAGVRRQIEKVEEAPGDASVDREVEKSGISRAGMSEEKRADPDFGYRLVTYAEMCQRLSNQPFSDAQLWSRWQNLHPAEAGAIIANLTGGEADASNASSSNSSGNGVDTESRKSTPGLTYTSAPEVAAQEALPASDGDLHVKSRGGDAAGRLQPADAAAVPSSTAKPRLSGSPSLDASSSDHLATSSDSSGAAATVNPEAAAAVVEERQEATEAPDAPVRPPLPDQQSGRTHLAHLLEGYRNAPIRSPDENVDTVKGRLCGSDLRVPAALRLGYHGNFIGMISHSLSQEYQANSFLFVHSSLRAVLFEPPRNHPVLAPSFVFGKIPDGFVSETLFIESVVPSVVDFLFREK